MHGEFVMGSMIDQQLIQSFATQIYRKYIVCDEYDRATGNVSPPEGDGQGSIFRTNYMSRASSDWTVQMVYFNGGGNHSSSWSTHIIAGTSTAA